LQRASQRTCEATSAHFHSSACRPPAIELAMAQRALAFSSAPRANWRASARDRAHPKKTGR
jgi:hypothetical protein